MMIINVYVKVNIDIACYCYNLLYLLHNWATLAKQQHITSLMLVIFIAVKYQTTALRLGKVHIEFWEILNAKDPTTDVYMYIIYILLYIYMYMYINIT